MKRQRLWTIVMLVSSMAFGYAAWILPRLLIPGQVSGHLPLLIHYSTDRELANICSLLSLGMIGLVLGVLCPNNYGRSALLAAATALPIIVLATVEGALGLAAHSLYGIELFVYGMFTIPAIGAALMGSFVAGIMVRKMSGNEKGASEK